MAQASPPRWPPSKPQNNLHTGAQAPVFPSAALHSLSLFPDKPPTAHHRTKPPGVEQRFDLPERAKLPLSNTNGDELKDITMRQRIIVCPLIENQGEYLLCKMADDRGVFPGQWALSGGGMEPGETMEQALRREITEELGDRLVISQVTPWAFRDDVRIKTYADGSQEEIYMIYLIFDCVAANRDIVLNEEFQDHAWVKPDAFPRYDLNVATRATLTQKGLL